MIAILTLTLAAGKLYVKGITNKSINQSGREIQDTVRRDFLAADATLISPIYTAGTGTSMSGRICLGGVSYVWNTADILNDTTSNGTSNRITLGGKPIHFARIADTNATMCVKGGGGKYPTVIPSTLVTTELLGGDGRDFALYAMAITAIARQDSSALYQLKYTVGTNDKGTTEVDAIGGYTRCKPDASVTANFSYCSVSDFDMIVRVQGGVN